MKFKSSRLFKTIALLICFSLLFEQSGFAQIAAQLDISGKLSGLVNSIAQDKFRPLHLRYLQYDTKLNNFKLLLDKGSSKELSKPFIEQSTKTLLNYFLVGVTLPNDTFWVNLRPDSPDNVIDSALAQTDIGRIMLEADVQLKKDTASFTSPNTPEGKQYWDKLYTKAGELFGSQNITIPTLTRPWIVPNEIIIRETTDNAYIYKATLKVMLEDDYLKTGKGIATGIDYSFKDERFKELNQYSSQLIRQLIIPKLTKEINTSKRYANLRQVYYSLILAQWFKQRFANNSGAYSKLINQKNLTNLTSKTSWEKNTYFQQYQKSFKNGEYDIKTPVTTHYGQVIRSYFSGGIQPMLPKFPAPGKTIELTDGRSITSVKADEDLPTAVAGSGKLAVSFDQDGVVKTTDQAQPSNGFKIEDQTTPPKVENGISVKRVDLSKLPLGAIIKYRISNDNWNYTLRVEANGRVSIWLREDQGRITASIKAIGSRVPSLTPGDAYDADFFGEIEPGVLAYQPYFNQTDIAGSKVRELVSIGDYPIQATPEDIMVYLPDGKTQLPREKPRELQDKFKRKVKELNEFIVHHGIPGEKPLEANGFEFLVNSGITKVEILAERLGMDKDSLEEILSAVEEQKGWDIIEKTIDASTFSFAFEKLAKLQAEKNLYPKPQKTIKEKADEFKDKVIKFVKDETGSLQLTGYRQDKKFNQKIAMDKKLAGFYAIAEDQLERLQKFPDKQDLVIELIENKFAELIKAFPRQHIELNNAKNELINELAINLSSGQEESIYLHGYYEILKNILNKLIPWMDDLKKENPDSEFIFVARDAGYIYTVFNALGRLDQEKSEGFVYYLSRASMATDLTRNGPYDTAKRLINQAHGDTKTHNIIDLTATIRKLFKDYLARDDSFFPDETSRKEHLEFKNMVIKVNSELKALGYSQLQKLVLVDTGFKGTMPHLMKFILDLDKTDEQLANEVKANGGRENIQVAVLEPRDMPAFTEGVYGLTSEQAETALNKFEDFWGGQAVETPESVVDLLEKIDIVHPVEFNLIDSKLERNSNAAELLKYFVSQLVVGLETIAYYNKTRMIDVAAPVNKPLVELSFVSATEIIGSALDKGNNSLDGLIAETPDYTGKLVQLQNPKQMSAGNFDGTSHLQFTDDPQGKAGQVWLFKGYPRQKWHRALVDEFVYHVAEKLGLKSAIPVFAGRIKNGYMTEFGMFMRWEENIGSLYEVYRGDFIQKLSENKENLKIALREQVLDWLVSQHDSHSRNFLIAEDKDKSLIPIDFSQAFKFLGRDELSLDYNPNGDVNGYNNVAYMPIYNLIYQAIINKEIDFTLTEAWEVVREVIERVEEMDTDEYVEALKPYAEFRFKIMKDSSGSIRNSDEFLKLARERKVNMRKDFEEFFENLRLVNQDLVGSSSGAMKSLGLRASAMDEDSVELDLPKLYAEVEKMADKNEKRVVFNGTEAIVIQLSSDYLGKMAAYHFNSKKLGLVIVVNSDLSDAIQLEGIVHESSEAIWMKKGFNQHEAHVIASAEQIKPFLNRGELSAYHESQINTMSYAQLLALVQEKDRSWQHSVLINANKRLRKGGEINLHSIKEYEALLQRKAQERLKVLNSTQGKQNSNLLESWNEADYRFSLLEVMENPFQEKREFYVDQFNALWIFNENLDIVKKPYKSLAAKTYHQFMGKVLDRNSIVLEVTFKAKDGRMRTGTMQKVFYQDALANKELKELNLADFRDWSQNRVSIKFWGLEPPKIKQVLEEMVIDWLFANYSSTESTWFEHGYAKFYLICLDDKSDSFKDFPNDRLEAKKDSDDKTKPPFAYNLVKYLALQNSLSMDLIEEILKKIENIQNSELEELIRPLAEKYAAANPDKFKRPEDFIKAFLSRKNNLRKDFKDFFHQSYLIHTPFNSQVQAHQAMTDKYIISQDLYQQIHNAQGDQAAIIKLINQRFNELAENLSWEEVELLAQKKEELIIRITGPPVFANQDERMDLQTNPIVRDRKFKAMSRLLASWVYSLREQKPDYYMIGLARDGGYIPLIDQLFNYAKIIPKTSSSVYHLSCPRMSGETQKKIYSMMYEIIANALKNVKPGDLQGLYVQIRLGFNKAMLPNENPKFAAMAAAVREELKGLGFDQKNKIMIVDTGFFGTIAFYIKCILDMDKSQARLEQELVDNNGHENIEVAILQPSSIESFSKDLFGFDVRNLTKDDQAIAAKLETVFGLRNILGNEFESGRIMHPIKFNEDDWLIEDTDASSQLELFYQQIMIAQMVDAFIAIEGIDYPAAKSTEANQDDIDLSEKNSAKAFFNQPDNIELKELISRSFKNYIDKEGYIAFKKLYESCDNRSSFLKLLRLKFALLSTDSTLNPDQEFKRQLVLVQYLLHKQGILTSNVAVAKQGDLNSLPFKTDKKFDGVLLDVDGTITMPGGEISDSIIQKIAELLNRGVKVGIVTGRNVFNLDIFAKMIKPMDNQQALSNLYIFTQGGAQGHSVGNPNVKWEFKADLNERKSILQRLEVGELDRFNCQIVSEPAKLIFKIDNHDETNDLILILRLALVDLGLDTKYSVVDAGANVHLISAQADKGAAAKKFSNVTGLPQENILKIGDNYNLDGNDYPMLALPGGVGVNDSETTLWLLDTYFKNTVLTPNIQLFALADEGTDPLSNSLHFVNNKDITSVILPKNKFAASVDMLKVFEESLQYELGKVPLFSIFGSLSYARDKEGNIIWNTIGDFDIKLYTEELLWNDDITEIKLTFLNALKNLGIKVDIQGSDSPSGSGRDLSSLNWGILDNQGKKYIVHIINFKTKDLLSKNDAFVNILSNLFYGDTQALNNALNIVGIETAAEQAAVICEKTISIISNAIAKVENIRSENVTLLKRLYQIAYVQGREADFYWLLEKYRELSLEFNQQDLADACNEGISKLIMNPEELRELLRDRIQANIKLVDSKSMATVSISGATSDKGGVDFRGLPIGIQSQRMVGASTVALIPSPRLDQEWSQIERMLNQGIIPSIERLKDYLSLSCKGADCPARVDQTLSGIANILRIEEESLTPTDAALKQLLILLESNQPANQLQLALTKIQASEKMPELAIH